MKVGPDYEEPVILLPDEWTAAIDKDNKSSVSGAQRWWMQFNDPTLNKLIAISRSANPNIRIASARIAESWHQRSTLAAAWYPHSDFNGRDNYGIGNYDRSGFDFGNSDNKDQFAEIDYGIELDFFGKIKRQVESATAGIEAKVEGLRDATVFINAEVALHYIAYRTLEQRIIVAQEGVQNFKEIQEAIAIRLEEGVASQMELHEASGRFKSSQAEIPALIQEKIVVRNRLAALLAMQPGNIAALLKNNQKIPEPPRTITAGFPAELLRSRPDIRRAERNVAAQSAQIGVATARLYPELSLSGAISFDYLRDNFSVSELTRVIGIGPSLKWRLFHACADRARIYEEETKLTQAVTLYESTIIEAVTEVENAMTRLYHTKKRLSLLTEATQEHKQASELMLDAYQNDQVDLKRLLNAQDDYIRNKDEAIATEGRRAAHSVRLFKALGGGELPPPAKAYQASQPANKSRTN